MNADSDIRAVTLLSFDNIKTLQLPVLSFSTYHRSGLPLLESFGMLYYVNFILAIPYASFSFSILTHGRAEAIPDTRY